MPQWEVAVIVAPSDFTSSSPAPTRKHPPSFPTGHHHMCTLPRYAGHLHLLSHIAGLFRDALQWTYRRACEFHRCFLSITSRGRLLLPMYADQANRSAGLAAIVDLTHLMLPNCPGYQTRSPVHPSFLSTNRHILSMYSVYYSSEACRYLGTLARALSWQGILHAVNCSVRPRYGLGPLHYTLAKYSPTDKQHLCTNLRALPSFTGSSFQQAPTKDLTDQYRRPGYDCIHSSRQTGPPWSFESSPRSNRKIRSRLLSLPT